MIKRYIFQFAGGILLLSLLGCSLPGSAPSLTVDEQAATIIAGTLTALAGNGSGTEAPTTAASPVTPNATLTTTSTPGATPTITPTYSTPMLTVLEATNCREGPGEGYPVIFTHLADVELEIIGRHEPTNFWLVKSPQSSTGTCWLWGEFVELSGSYWVVPTVTPPPTATFPPPRAPAPVWEFSCSGGNMTFVMEWEDRATDEAGYRVFRDGEAITELPANSTSFTETIPIEGNESAVYYLQVFGPTGTADSPLMRINC